MADTGPQDTVIQPPTFEDKSVALQKVLSCLASLGNDEPVLLTAKEAGQVLGMFKADLHTIQLPTVAGNLPLQECVIKVSDEPTKALIRAAAPLRDTGSQAFPVVSEQHLPPANCPPLALLPPSASSGLLFGAASPCSVPFPSGPFVPGHETFGLSLPPGPVPIRHSLGFQDPTLGNFSFMEKVTPSSNSGPFGYFFNFFLNFFLLFCSF